MLNIYGLIGHYSVYTRPSDKDGICLTTCKTSKKNMDFKSQIIYVYKCCGNEKKTSFNVYLCPCDNEREPTKGKRRCYSVNMLCNKYIWCKICLKANQRICTSVKVI